MLLGDVSFEVQPLAASDHPVIRRLIGEISWREWKACVRRWHGNVKIFLPFDMTPISVPTHGYSVFFPQGYFKFIIEAHEGKPRLRVIVFEVYWRLQGTTWGFSLAKKFIALCRAAGIASIVGIPAPHKDIPCRWDRMRVRATGRRALQEFYWSLGFRPIVGTADWHLMLS